MDELRRAMLDAGAPRDEWQADLTGLVAAGQQRVRRRRMIATGVAAAVVTAIGTTAVLAGVPGLNKSDPDPVKEDQNNGIYVEERISVDEVERRCNLVLDRRQGTANRGKEWVAGVDSSGRAVPAAVSAEPVETRTGRTVTLAEPGAFVATPGSPGGSGGTDPGGGVTQEQCAIPEDDMITEIGPGTGPVDLDDHDAVIERCSQTTGYDLTGWTVLAATKQLGLMAVFLSDNGFGVVCDVGFRDLRFYEERLRDDNDEPLLPESDTGPADPDRYGGLAPVCSHPSHQSGESAESAESAMSSCGAVGIIPGLPDGYRIEFDLPTGDTHTTVTRQGGFAYQFRVPAIDGVIRFPTRVISETGELVWEGSTTTGGDGDDGGWGGGGGISVVPPEFPRDG